MKKSIPFLFIILNLSIFCSKRTNNSRVLDISKIDWTTQLEQTRQLFPILFLEDINIFDFKVVLKAKINQERKVYYDTENKLYYKVWHPDYYNAFFFLEAVKKRFYNHLAPLKCIIFDHNNRCRGYVCYALEGKKELSTEPIDSKSKAHRLKDTEHQNETYKAFYNQLINNINETDIIYYDLTPSNIASDGNHYYIVDLEAVVPLHDYIKITNINPSLKFNPVDYSAFLRKLFTTVR